MSQLANIKRTWTVNYAFIEESDDGEVMLRIGHEVFERHTTRMVDNSIAERLAKLWADEVPKKPLGQIWICRPATFTDESVDDIWEELDLWLEGERVYDTAYMRERFEFIRTKNILKLKGNQYIDENDKIRYRDES